MSAMVRPAAQARHGIDERRSGQAPQDLPRRREDIWAVGGPLQDRDRIGGEIRPARVPSRSRALEQGESGEIAEALGGIDGRHRIQLRNASSDDTGNRSAEAIEGHGTIIRAIPPEVRPLSRRPWSSRAG